MKIAAIQMSMTDNLETNVAKAIQMVREAASKGANLILVPELFENLYWCQVQREEYFKLANPLEAHPFLPKFIALARELNVVLPISFFEKAGHAHFNSLAMIDAARIWACTGSRTSRMDLGTPKSIISIRATPGSRRFRLESAWLARAFVGINGIQNRLERWRCRVQKSCCTRPRLVPNPKRPEHQTPG
jgi:Carbon-nitrogen hydrolase